MKRLSCIVPSRLQKNPAARPDAGDLYLDRSLMSVVRNARDNGMELEICVGLDKGAGELPLRFTKCWDDSPQLSGAKCRGEAGHVDNHHDPASGESWEVHGWRPLPIQVGYSEGTGQAQAVNAAAKLITGDLVAFIEDDDMWRPDRLAVQLAALNQGYAFASSTQREIAEDGTFLRTNAFACPSTWVMPRETWDAVGPFDETFRWHVDTEWLGRLNAYCAKAGKKRAHFTHEGAHTDGGWIDNVARFSDLLKSDEVTDPLVDRTVNTKGGMSAIRADSARLVEAYKASRPEGDILIREEFEDFAAEQPTPYGQSIREHRVMFANWGVIPW